MKGTQKRSSRRRRIPRERNAKLKATSSSTAIGKNPLKDMLNQFSLLQQKHFLESESSDALLHQSSGIEFAAVDANALEEKDFILSQDFFCTPDYITPECQNIFNNLDEDKENIACPESPKNLKSTKRKRFKQVGNYVKSPDSASPDRQQVVELSTDVSCFEEIKADKGFSFETGKKCSYVPQSAVALRCRVMPPPCIKNPYLKNASDLDVDPFGCWRSKCSGYFPASTGTDGLSRYRTDFHEIEQIGNGNFSHVFKVLKRMDGCMYAVKHTAKQLHQDTDRTKALMEVQALAALGFHENVVAYYTSWIENEQLYIQMELCDHSLSKKCLFSEVEVLLALYQIAKALQFVHERGMAHLDVKPDNIYVKNGTYKLGDFGCATLLNKSLPIEEGDARYMPQEILNENYDYLEKVDIFSLGASMYQLLRGSSLPNSGQLFMNLKEGKIPLLPGHSLPLQNLLKVMVNPDPTLRPSAKEIVENPIFDRVIKNAK